MPYNEADTCRIQITPKLRESEWETHPHSITEQYTFTDGRVKIRGTIVKRGEQKRADYLLRYTLLPLFRIKPSRVDYNHAF